MAYFPKLSSGHAFHPPPFQGTHLTPAPGHPWAFGVPAHRQPVPMIPANPESSQSPEIKALQSRIVALQAELDRATAETASVQAANETLLQCLRDGLKAGEASGGRLLKDKVKLKVRLSALKQENAKLKIKARKAMSSVSTARLARLETASSSSRTYSLLDATPLPSFDPQRTAACHQCSHFSSADEPGGGNIIDSPVPELFSIAPSLPSSSSGRLLSTAASETREEPPDIYLLDQFLLPLGSPEPRPTRPKTPADSYAYHFGDGPKEDGPPACVDLKLTTKDDVPATKAGTDPPHEKPLSVKREQTNRQPSTLSGSSTSFLPSRPGPTPVRRSGDRKISIRWLSSDHLFDSEPEFQNVVRLQGFRSEQGHTDLPDFFNFGIRFVPEKDDAGFYRTVLMTNLPRKIPMKALLGHVRGGPVVSAKLADTRAVTGSSSAMVEFLEGSSAAAFANFVQTHNIVIRGCRVYAEQVTTPTWPVSRQLAEDISTKGLTRCLEMAKYPRDISKKILKEDLQPHAALDYDVVEFMELRPSDALRISFSSIQAAAAAKTQLKTKHAYRALRISFVPDPCANPLEELLDDPA
ncbi:MAG: hypothetical protein M1838_000965 [Thelocarpon superellum]|nr:MAG: hypothetical protein M1838_000965 [Thelocarpon superellum]